jgi:hypothetical protein
MKAFALALCTCVVLAGCGREGARDGVVQTRMPGMVTAGGRTSGEVLAAASTGGAVQPGPAGTPGIPRGSEGNVGGTALGGSVAKDTNVAATTTTRGAPAGPAPAGGAASAPPAADAPALTDAQKAQAALDAAMDAVAARWRSRAAAQGRATRAPTPVDGTGGIQASAVPTAAPQPAQDIRSEKLGTAPPSADVKTRTKPVTDPVLDPKSPAAAGHKP